MRSHDSGEVLDGLGTVDGVDDFRFGRKPGLGHSKQVLSSHGTSLSRRSHPGRARLDPGSDRNAAATKVRCWVGVVAADVDFEVEVAASRDTGPADVPDDLACCDGTSRADPE